MSTLLSRRDFLRASAAAGAVLAAGPVLSACSGDDDPRISSVAIHPALAIARVGNSPDSFFFGPEIPGTVPIAPDGFKDADGAMARQAARFRIFGLDEDGNVVRELTNEDATISWSVSVANKKAAWYDTNFSMDLPVATPVSRRNDDVTGSDRDGLIIVPGPHSIDGTATGAVGLDGGEFMGEPVSLGELLTDERGRLVFMPAAGSGFSPTNAPLTTFSDNDGWGDDICDGPVMATVRIGDRELAADPAWVIVTPPSYAPSIATGLVTAFDSARTAWMGPDDVGSVSFANDVLPIFSRTVDMQWVNAGYFELNGWGSPGDYLSSPLLEQLADPSAANAAFRTELLDRFRDPDYATEQPTHDPFMYGDGVAIPPESPYQWLTVTPIQYRQLELWAAGDFTDDRDELIRPEGLSALAVGDQPAALDRAGLESCLGGAFHPGVELPWALRTPSMWAEPLRLAMRTFEADDTDYGDELTPEATLAAGGPLDGSGPGDITRWMGVPWQGDAGSCRSGYRPEISPVLPTFWPARIPNHVLREQDYDVVMDTTLPREERREAFERRYQWQRFAAGPNTTTTLDAMMDSWWELGVILDRPGPEDGEFPSVMRVESLVGFDSEPDVTYSSTHEERSPEYYDGEVVRE